MRSNFLKKSAAFLSYGVVINFALAFFALLTFSAAATTHNVSTAAELSAALAASADNDEIVLASGTYKISATLNMSSAVTLRSASGVPEDVIIDATGRRAMSITSAGAKVLGVTIHGGGSYANPGNITMSGGIVSNCVIRNGSTGSNHTTKGGGVNMSAGLLTHCVVTNNQASSMESGAGHGILASGGRVENCLIAYNRDWATSNVTGTKVGGALNLRGMLLRLTARLRKIPAARSRAWLLRRRPRAFSIA